MIGYLLIIFLSIVFYKLFEKNRNLLFLFIALVIPITIEGLRDQYVGVDMLGYGTVFFYENRYYQSLSQWIRDYEGKEYGFQLILYICYHITKQINLYMTVCAAIKIGCLYTAAYKMRKNIDTGLFLFGYLIYFYCLGFSMMRQSIAIAIFTLGVVVLSDGKWKQYLIYIVAAYLFHNSALIGLALLPILWLKNKKFKYQMNIVMALFMLVSFNFLFVFIGISGLVRSDFIENYTDSGVNTAKTNIVVSVLFLIVGIYYKLKKIGSNDSAYLCIVTSIYTLTLLALANVFETAYRVSFYFFIPSLWVICSYLKRYKNDTKIILSFLFIVLFVGCFYFDYAHGLSGTLPYKSDYLPIYIPDAII